MSFTTHLMWITNRFNVIHVQISRQFWAEKVNDIDIKLIGRVMEQLSSQVSWMVSEHFQFGS